MNNDPDDVLDGVIEPEEMGGWSSEEEIKEFLNHIDKGTVGIEAPKIERITIFEKVEYPESDNWAGDPSEAWA